MNRAALAVAVAAFVLSAVPYFNPTPSPAACVADLWADAVNSPAVLSFELARVIRAACGDSLE